MTECKIEIPSLDLNSPIDPKSIASLLVKNLDIAEIVANEKDLSDIIDIGVEFETYPRIYCRIIIKNKCVFKAKIYLHKKYDILQGDELYKDILDNISNFVDRDFRLELIAKIIEYKEKLKCQGLC